ncbi:hypothetical protein OG458_42975 (plasmid) [Streptomyces sp. NBC_01281]|uniref:hypothetical protein n=1 Tax=Streptomyces sp. NBC_01281 TaxID=2903811 RepID=UPI002E161EB5|nr:hypothetical protein OG458_42975 [Streptomyces sp. NBC_01281]
MTTEFLSSADREKSPLLDADFDAVRIAAALLNSPRILTASAEPGDDTVRFTGQDGTRYTLSLQSAEPADNDGPLRAVVLTEALAAAILNSPHFVAATADSTRKDTITVQTRDRTRYLLAVDADYHPVAGGHEASTPAADLAAAADQALTGDPGDAERAMAELLTYIAATWDRQDRTLREHAQTVAHALSTR